MLVVAPVQARLEALIPALADRIEGAMEFAELQRTKGTPRYDSGAFVMPAGVRPTSGDTGLTGLFHQPIDRIVSVVLYLKSYSQTGHHEVADLEQLVEDVTLAICAWSPDAADGAPFRLVRSQLLAFSAGLVSYHLDFALSDYIRILS